MINNILYKEINYSFETILKNEKDNKKPNLYAYTFNYKLEILYSPSSFLKEVCEAKSDSIYSADYRNPLVVYLFLSSGTDRDRCISVKKIYKQLWKRYYPEFDFDENKNIYISGDTLTSPYTVIKSYISLFHTDFFNEISTLDKKIYSRGKDFYLSTLKRPEVLNHLTRLIEKDKECGDLIMEFIWLSHTIGNFIPLVHKSGTGAKGSINCQRSKPTNDTMCNLIRLASENIKTRDSKSNNTLKKNIELWLKPYTSIEEFLEKNYFCKSILNNIEKFEYVPNKNKDSFIKFLKFTNKTIRERGELIVREYNKELSNN